MGKVPSITVKKTVDGYVTVLTVMLHTCLYVYV